MITRRVPSIARRLDEVRHLAFLGAFLMAGAALLGSPGQTATGRSSASPPPVYPPPPLNPTGVVLETRPLSEGVYALLSNTPFADNEGFIVGREAVLVVDSGFNGRIGQQIINSVRRVTESLFDISSTRMLSATTTLETTYFRRRPRSSRVDVRSIHFEAQPRRKLPRGWQRPSTTTSPCLTE
jgi:hypothetical protein